MNLPWKGGGIFSRNAEAGSGGRRIHLVFSFLAALLKVPNFHILGENASSHAPLPCKNQNFFFFLSSLLEPLNELESNSYNKKAVGHFKKPIF